MHPDATPPEPDPSNPGADPPSPGDPFLNRLRVIAGRIAEGVHKLLGDAEAHGSLPTDPTDETPPVQ